MKKVLSLLLVVCLCCGVIVGCGGEKLVVDKPYGLKTNDFECEITINKAQKTSLMYDFSEEEAETQDIVMLELELEAVSVENDIYMSSYDIWNNIRLTDDGGNEIKPFEYVLPGDEESLIVLEVGDTSKCTIPYPLEKGCRYVEIDVYQNSEFSNKIRLDVV